jgi:16S rRNA (guanine(966)-N(2))-methyltransferase RsmD
VKKRDYPLGNLKVIGGERRGFRLTAPRGSDLRPTSGRVREAVFDILSGEILGTRWLDLFAGTGAMGIEALSRGAVSCVFLEEDRFVGGLIQKNLEVCGYGSRAEVILGELPYALSRLPPNGEFDLVFVDPPYGDRAGEATLTALGDSRILSPRARIILEHRKSWVPPGFAGRLSLQRSARYGDTTLSFFGMSIVRQPPVREGGREEV